MHYIYIYIIFIKRLYPNGQPYLRPYSSGRELDSWQSSKRMNIQHHVFVRVWSMVILWVWLYRNGCTGIVLSCFIRNLTPTARYEYCLPNFHSKTSNVFGCVWLLSGAEDSEINQSLFGTVSAASPEDVLSEQHPWQISSSRDLQRSPEISRV